MENMELIINGIYYYIYSADDLQSWYGITIDDEYGAAYYGPESGVYTDEVIEVPESIIVEGQTIPVVSFGGGYNIYNEEDAASVSEVILPSSILLMEYGFTGFTGLQKVTCYAETAPKLSSELGEPSGTDFEVTPSTKELYIPSGSDYSTWEADTTWASVNEIYDGFVEIVNGLKYKETGETTVALIGYEEGFNSTTITIPSSIPHEGKTYTVTEIRKNSFENYTGLTEVNIPDSVTKISETAFSNTYLEETQTISGNNISLNVISIDTRLDKFLLRNTSGITFTYGDITETTTEYACECLGLTDDTTPTPTLDLTNLVYDNNINILIYTIKERAFANNNSIITAILPEETILIEGYIFVNCQNLDTIYFNCKSAQSLSNNYGVMPFFGLNNPIKTIIIGNSVTSIGGGAFYGCSSLTSVYLLNPTAPTSYLNTFQNTPSTKVLIVPIDATGYSTSWAGTTWAVVNYNMVPTEEIVYKFNDEHLLETFSSNSKTESLTIPHNVLYKGIGYNVEKVSRNSLANDNKIKTLTIESGINKIEASALSGCNNLETVNIPDSVTKIDNHAFWMCKNLKTINLPSNLNKLKPEMFVACEELQEITIPNGITTIPFRMFEGCKNLTKVNLPDTITEIQWSAFKDCKNLTTINIPSGCNVDSTAFEGTNITV